MKTFSLAQVAEQALPKEWKLPELWLQRRLRRGEISGYKVGNTWRMTEADVDAMITRYHNTAVTSATKQSAPRQLSFSATSRRRMRSAS